MACLLEVQNDNRPVSRCGSGQSLITTLADVAGRFQQVSTDLYLLTQSSEKTLKLFWRCTIYLRAIKTNIRLEKGLTKGTRDEVMLSYLE